MTISAGVSPWLREEALRPRVLRCLEEMAPGASHGEIWLDDRFIGTGYGHLTDASVEAIHRVARTEAIVLDHVYTGKAMAGLLHYVAEQAIPQGARVLFWHTGGAAGLFAKQDRWPYN